MTRVTNCSQLERQLELGIVQSAALGVLFRSSEAAVSRLQRTNGCPSNLLLTEHDITDDVESGLAQPEEPTEHSSETSQLVWCELSCVLIGSLSGEFERLQFLTVVILILFQA